METTDISVETCRTKITIIEYPASPADQAYSRGGHHVAESVAGIGRNTQSKIRERIVGFVGFYRCVEGLTRSECESEVGP